MNENESLNTEEPQETPVVPMTEQPAIKSQENAAMMNKTAEKPKKRTPAWQWLLASMLLIGLLIFVFMTPSLSRYLPMPSRSPAVPSAQSNVQYQSSTGHSVRPEGVSSVAGMATLEAYGALTLGVPIMIGILVFLTFLNFLLFIGMTIDIHNIKKAIVDIYETTLKNK